MDIEIKLEDSPPEGTQCDCCGFLAVTRYEVGPIDCRHGEILDLCRWHKFQVLEIYLENVLIEKYNARFLIRSTSFNPFWLRRK